MKSFPTKQEAINYADAKVKEYPRLDRKVVPVDDKYFVITSSDTRVIYTAKA